MNARLGRHPVVLLGIFAVYAGLGHGAFALGAIGGGATAVFWPASGFALAALIIFGLGVWPAILLGAVAAHAAPAGSILAALAMAAGHTLESVVAAALISRFAGGMQVFRATNSGFRAIAMVAGAAMMPACASLLTQGSPAVALTWGLASLAGTLVVGPAMIYWATLPIARPQWSDWPVAAEVLTLVGVVAVLSWGIFSPAVLPDARAYPVEFLFLPLFFWAAFRFGPRGITAVVVLTAAVAVSSTVRGFGPFARSTPLASALVAQTYVGVMAIMGIAFSSTMGERLRAEAQLHTLATTDPLTGLANYRRLLDVLRQEIARSRRTGRPFAVLLLDMNGLKKINDRYGHLAGSRAICRVAGVLRQACRETDTPARFGGDEFAIVLAETGDEGGQAVLRRVTQRLATDTAKPVLSVGGGHAVFPRDGDSPTLLLRAADRALYESKKQGQPFTASAQQQAG